MFIHKFKVINAKYSSQIFYFKRFTSNHHILTNLLGISTAKAKNYVKQHRLLRIEPEWLEKNITYCKNIGFDDDGILQNPILLRINPNTLDQYHTVMNEGGFINILPQVLGKFRTLYKKPVGVLKQANLIDSETDVAQRFITYLNPCPTDFYVKTNGDFEGWSDVHTQVLKEYLKWRLQITEADVNRLIKIHQGMRRKSFRYLCQNIAMAEDLGFTPEKMLKYGYILHCYPTHAKTTLEKYPTLAGSCMRKAMRMYPKLITVSPTNIEKIYITLKEHNIPDIAIQKRMNVFQLSPETVKFRLKELKNTAVLKVLLHNPNILKLVVHHNRAKSRLSFLKKLQLRCAGVSVLGNDDTKFDSHVREGRDANTATDMYAFLKGIFNRDIKNFEKKLKRHPYYLQIPLVSMENTYNLLKIKQFSAEAISDVIYILLYPAEKVEQSFEQVESFEKETERVLSEVNKLNLALYFIEKEHHFTGDGVWTKEDVIEEGNL